MMLLQLAEKLIEKLAAAKRDFEQVEKNYVIALLISIILYFFSYSL